MHPFLSDSYNIFHFIITYKAHNYSIRKGKFNHMQLLDKPKTLCCYICGREFGTTSLSIHLKSCMKKFENEQSKKQVKDRIKLPNAPEQLQGLLNGNLDLQTIGMQLKSYQIYKYQVLPKCRFCSRTFNEESLKVHENGCSKKGNQKIQQKSVYNFADQFRKPRTLTCCICGREFGLTSLKIHYPQCLQKFENQENKKPKNERRTTPQFSQEQLDMINNKQEWTLEEIEAFNNKAMGNYRQKAMVQCTNCGRKFFPQSYPKHRKNCVLINGQNPHGLSQPKAITCSHSSDASFRNIFSDFKKPRTLTCCVCGRDFGLASLKIHYPQCIQKFENQQNKKPREQRKATPKFSQELLWMVNNKQDWTLEQIDDFNNRASEGYREKAMVRCGNCGRKFLSQSYQKHKKNCILINGENKNNRQENRSKSVEVHKKEFWEFKKPRTLTCCVCGRDFGLTSLKIHYPQCLQKFDLEEKKKPASERKQPPKFTQEQLQMINNKEDWNFEEIQKFNNRANVDYREKAMVQCQNCGRKFLAQSYLKHKKNCILINGQINSTSGSQSKLPAPDYLSLYNVQAKKPKVLMCHICGRQFGLTSLGIHIPQCQQKFLNQQNKKPTQQRKSLPIFHTQELEKYDLKTASEWTSQVIEAYNKIANDIYRSQALCACPICGRKFFQQSLPKHLKYCEKNQQKRDGLSSSSSMSKLSQSFDMKQLSLKSKNSMESNNNIKESLNSSMKKLSKQSSRKNTSLQIKTLLQELPLKKQSLSKKNIIDGESQNNSQILEVNELLEQTLQDCNQSTVKSPKLMNDSNEFQSETQQILKQEGEQIQSKLQSSTEKNQNQSEQKSISIHNAIQEQNQEYQQIEDSPNTKQKLKTKKGISGKKLEIEVLDDNLEKSMEKQSLNQMVSPTMKAKMSRGFAAPRKKEQYLQSEMKQCKICNRKFDSDRIQKHEKICADNKQRQKKSTKNLKLTMKQIKIPSPQKTESKGVLTDREVITPEQKIRLKMGFASPRMKQLNLQNAMVECKGCNRKFPEQKIEKHEFICKKSQTQSKNNLAKSIKLEENINEGKQEQVMSIKRVPCPKCGRKFLQERLPRHHEACNSKIYLDDALDAYQIPKNFNKKKSLDNSKEQTPSNSVKDSTIEQVELQNLVLEPCQKCGRKFNVDRLSKHQQVCKGALKNMDPQLTQPNFRKTKSFFSEKESKNTEKKKQYNLDNLQIRNEQQADERVECPKCLRKFIPDRLEKHVNACKSVPPLSNIAQKGKLMKKQPQKVVDKIMSEVISSKIQDRELKMMEEDQQIQSQLQQCSKCNRKFLPQHIYKHLEVCNRSNKLKINAKPTKPNINGLNSPKFNDQVMRKTKNEFFNMVKDLKDKKVKGQDIEKQLDIELFSIQNTHKITKKQNFNHHNKAEPKKRKESSNKSVVLPKI